MDRVFQYKYILCLHRQVDGVEGVQIWGKLYYVDDSPATVNHNWHVHENQVCIYVYIYTTLF